MADGSGGHLIPALQVAASLARHGVRSQVWYAQRREMASLTEALTRDAQRAAVETEPVPIPSSPTLLGRLWHGGRLWRRAQRCLDTFAPHVVVGFGGWVSIPVVLAARLRLPLAGQHPSGRRIGCLLHEQNVVVGRANRWLAPWADRIAVSFRDTTGGFNGTSAVVTGLPVRDRIGRVPRAQGAARFGWRPDRPTLLILGGSQGARALNRLMMEVAPRLSPDERRTWQLIHLVGPRDEAAVRAAYAAQGVQAWVSPFLGEMETAYAQADVALARAGASTIAELARCGIPAILIPYPHAGHHQAANARLVEAAGGGVRLDESEARAEGVLSALRRILADARLRGMMGAQMRSLQSPGAAERLADVILELARAGIGGARR